MWLFALNNWIGAARLPAALHRAGFEVVVLCPSGSFMAATRFVNRRLEMRGRVEANAISKTIWQEVTELGTTAVIATDQRSVEFMHAFAAAVQQGTFSENPGIETFQAMLERSLPPIENPTCGLAITLRYQAGWRTSPPREATSSSLSPARV